MEGANVIENGGGSGKLCLSKIVTVDLTRRSIALNNLIPVVTVFFENGLVLR